jgi:hypothetical protein
MHTLDADLDRAKRVQSPEQAKIAAMSNKELRSYVGRRLTLWERLSLSQLRWEYRHGPEATYVSRTLGQYAVVKFKYDLIGWFFR